MYFYGVLLTKFFEYLDQKYQEEKVDFNSKLDYFFEVLETAQGKITTLNFYNIDQKKTCHGDGFIAIHQSTKAVVEKDVLEIIKKELVNNLKLLELEDFLDFISNLKIEDLQIVCMGSDDRMVRL